MYFVMISNVEYLNLILHYVDTSNRTEHHFIVRVMHVWSKRNVHFTLIHWCYFIELLFSSQCQLIWQHFTDKPEITITKTLALYQLGQNYSLECIAFAYPLPRIRWYAQHCNNFPDCGNAPFDLISVRTATILVPMLL